MSRGRKFLMLLITALVVAGAAFLATWDIPAPSTKVEIVVPDDRFPR